MNCSVKVRDRPTIYFLMEVPDNPDGSLEIEEGAWVEVSMQTFAWPQGMPSPETLLCRSREDPKHYKVFNYRNQIEATEWEILGSNFGGTFNKYSWKRFASLLPAIHALHAIPDDEVT